MKKLTLDECIDIAIKHNGKCLSKKYVNAQNNLTWECQNGHIWEAAFGNIKRGGWCRKCGGYEKYTIEYCKEIAIERDGSCISNEYKNAHTLMEWKCQFGHIWKTGFSGIIGGHWCKKCSKAKYTQDDCMRIANERGGKCLSTGFINTSMLLKWECKEGHIWQASLDNILYNKSWCWLCYKYSIKECIIFAKNKKGKCLSTTYNDIFTKITWECENKHIWDTSLNVILNGSWCPKCAKIVSKAQKEIYDYLCNKYKIEIILNDTQTIKPFELDIYIPELRLGIEYDGDFWHYSEWAKINKDATNTMKRKNKKCKEKDIILLRIRESNWNKNKEKELDKINMKINNIKGDI